MSKLTREELERAASELADEGAWDCPPLDPEAMTVERAERNRAWRLLEELALTIEALLDELRRRGDPIDFDLSSYDEYRAQNPKKDA